MSEYWTLELFENAGVKDIEIEGKKLKIKALDAAHLIKLFGGQDINALKDGSTSLGTEELLKNLELLDEVVIGGLVVPSVTKETVGKLGRFRQKIATEIMKFSGLGEEEAKATEEFRS